MSVKRANRDELLEQLRRATHQRDYWQMKAETEEAKAREYAARAYNRRQERYATWQAELEHVFACTPPDPYAHSHLVALMEALRCG